MQKAKLILHTKYFDEHGGLVEMKAYQVPKTDATSDGFKYSLVYVMIAGWEAMTIMNGKAIIDTMESRQLFIGSGTWIN